MALHVCFMMCVASASISLARRKDTRSARGIIASLQGTTQSIEGKAGIIAALQGKTQSIEGFAGTNRAQSHRVGSKIANRYILVQELENRRYGHGGPIVLEHVYTAHKKLGEGGYATAYKATEINGHKDVVLKILNEDTADDRVAQQQTFDECNVMQSLQREDLILIFPDGASKLMCCILNNIKVGPKGLGNDQFIVLEYGGVQLSDEPKLGVNPGYVKHRGKHIVEIVNQTLRGVVYLAGLGVAHRDLKPDNILVQYDASGNAQIKIIDFGVVAHGKDVHCDGSKCKRHNAQTDCTNGMDGIAVCAPPSIPSPSDSCSFRWEEYVFAPPEIRHDNERVCLTPDYPVDAFDIWSMGMTVLQLVTVRFEYDNGIGDGFVGDAPNYWKSYFLKETYLDSSSGKLLCEFCVSALQSDYSSRGRVGKSSDQLRVVDLLKIFDANFKTIHFPEQQETLIPVSAEPARQVLNLVTPRSPITQPEVDTPEELDVFSGWFTELKGWLLT